MKVMFSFLLRRSRRGNWAGQGLVDLWASWSQKNGKDFGQESKKEKMAVNGESFLTSEKGEPDFSSAGHKEQDDLLVIKFL